MTDNLCETIDFEEVYRIMNNGMNDDGESKKIQKLIEKIENKKLPKIPTTNSNDFIIWTRNLDLDKHKKWYLEFLDKFTTENMLIKKMNEINNFSDTNFPINAMKKYLINSFESLWFFSCDVFSSIFSNGDMLTDTMVRVGIYDIVGYDSDSEEN